MMVLHPSPNLAGASGWATLSCHGFVDNQVQPQSVPMVFNIGNFLQRLVLPPRVKHWTLATPRKKLIKMGAKVVRHPKYVFLRIVEVAVPRGLFTVILERIGRLREATVGLMPSR